MNRRISAIIIDDEPLARRLLHSMLEPHSGWITIAAEASNGREAIDLINERKPELVFLDIQMPDFTGFEVLEKISHHPDVIFTTAYEQYALKAFETFSVDYLLKPIREEHLENALQKLRSFGKKGSLNDFSQLQKLFESISTAKTPTAFPVRQGDKIILVRFETISHFEADDKYVSLFMTDGKKYLTDQTLTALSQKLPPEFLRVQKSFIINKERIREIRKHFNGRFVFIMDDIKQTRITTGLTFYETIKSELRL